MRPAAIAAWAMIALAGNVSAQKPTSSFRSGVEAVYLDVTVLDAKGGIVTGLTKDDFEISDEGVPHEVAVFSADPAPISVGVLVDASGSMTGERMHTARAAVTALGRSLAPGDLWSVAVFSTNLKVLSDWKAYDEAAAARLHDVSPGGSTTLFKSVKDFSKRIGKTPHRKRAMLVITDGADDVVMVRRRQRGSRGADFGPDGPPAIVDDQPRAVEELRKGEVLVYGMGLDWPVENKSLSDLHIPSLQALSDPTGGATAVVSTLSDAESAASRLANELRTQYTLGFYPQKAPDGKYRRVRVVAKNPAYRVRTRAGYLATRPR